MDNFQKDGENKKSKLIHLIFFLKKISKFEDYKLSSNKKDDAQIML